MRRSTALLGVSTAALVGLGAWVVPGAAAPTAPSTAQGGPTHLGAVLVGGSEVPGPGDTDGFGLADVRVGSSRVCWRITVKDAEPIVAAHIHAGPRGVAGPVVVPLEPFDNGCADVRSRLGGFIKGHPQQFYVNLHTADFPSGAVRGQLLR